MRVDFYLLEQMTMEACYKTACRIVDKAWQQGQRIFVLCQNIAQQEIVDTLLWTFDDTRFLPHQLQHQVENAEAPILLGLAPLSALPTNNYAILLNLTLEVPENFAQFQRVIEIVPATPEARAQARERYRFYRQHGCELHSHQLR